MQRLVSSSVLSLALFCAWCSLLAEPARAQLVNRDRSADPAPGDDDDDILAPVKTDKPGTRPVAPEPDEKPKDMKIGLVPLIPLGDAGKTLADQVTVGLTKQLGESSLFGAAALAVDVKSSGGAKLDPAAAQQALVEGKNSLEKASGLLQKLQFGKAKKAYEQALASLEKAAPVLADAQPLIDARLGLAEVAARQGQESDAEAQLAAAAVLNPEFVLDAKKYPPQFVRTHQKVRDAALKAERAALVVDVSGAGASVEIDGRPAGAAPVKITELPAGRHLLRAVREGLPGYGAMVDVKGGETATVSPGFVAKDGKSHVDDLQNNRLGPDAAKAVADAAKAAGQKGAVVGVLQKTSTSVVLQLVLVDAATGGMARLPEVTFQADLLDISIETLKARERVEELYGAEKTIVGAFSAEAMPVLLAGAKSGAAAEMSTVALRYDVKMARERPTSRLVTAEKKPADDDGAATAAGDDEDSRSVLSAGERGTRKRLDDEADPYASRGKDTSDVEDPDAPITEQGWFWPTVVGGGAAALAVISGVTVVTLIGVGVIADPRPANGATVTVAIP